MRAIFWTKYGPPDVLLLKEAEKPSPKTNEILVKIHATTVETGDCELRRYQIHNYLYLPLRLYFGLIKPRKNKNRLGQQFAGQIEAIGNKVIDYEVGDQILAPSPTFGTYADYISLPDNATIALKPANISYEEAATVPVGGLNALHFLRKGNVGSGDRVMIYGSTGAIGTYAVQLARIFGAEVTAVCGSSKMELVKSLGAQNIIDYKMQNCSQNSEYYDVIFDTIGKSPFEDCINALKPSGRYLLANPTLLQQFRGIWVSLTSNRKVLFELARYRKEDLVYLTELIESGKLKPVIDDHRFFLEQIVEAHRYVEQGHKTGNVVITL